ncbi:MAG: hypothetical protein ACRCST_17215 [Turicibacter sp.]
MKLTLEEYKRFENYNLLVEIHKEEGFMFTLDNIKIEIIDDKIMASLDSELFYLEPWDCTGTAINHLKNEVIRELIKQIETESEED